MDIDFYFKRLQNLADYLYQTPRQDQLEAAGNILQNILKDNLMLKMSAHINSSSLHTVMDKESIANAVEFIEKMVNDEKNPHKEYFQPGVKYRCGRSVRHAFKIRDQFCADYAQRHDITQ